MQLQAEPKGWSDSEVDQIIDSVAVIESHTQTMVDQQSQMLVVIVLLALFIVAQFAWHAMGQFMPGSREISADV